ncbi:putative six-hairpin glycosidase-like protein [Rosellinia necatrix]|uniref:Putative six-hairpin glycosidase-like protein n=1 Tax=Rosellinia necatrix TaxID=77044 RepID=A0A1S7UNY1_ROSNE|nr:putative six-hairpin glycosidase-like protein [Rosellinia necatrix]
MSLEIVSKVISQGYVLATHSWEFGAFAEALLEWHNPELSVFGASPFPDGQVPVVQVEQVEALSYAQPHIWTNSTTLVDGDGAAGDPASLAVSAILIGQTQPEFLSAASRQIEHLVSAVPRWPNGAISHREDYAELWADFVYMAPPALAYWAVQDANETLLRVAVEQCLLYRDALVVPRDDDDDGDHAAAAGLWHHIIGPRNQDLGIWSTGNAWAAAGMARVLATARRSPWAVDLAAPLSAAIRAILDAAVALDAAEPAEPLLRNYLDDATWFGELSGTALLAATAYHMAALEPAAFAGYVAWADAKRAEVLRRIGDDGLLSPVINPLDWNDRTPGTASPEAQSFAVLMFAAHRDFYDKSC